MIEMKELSQALMYMFSFHFAGCAYFFLRKKNDSLKVFICVVIVLITFLRFKFEVDELLAKCKQMVS